MRRIIYISRSRLGDNRHALDAMVAQSSVRNNAAGVTGMLWSGGGEIVQALEGEDRAVAQLMQRVAADSRHNDIVVVEDRDVRSRMFGSWGMAIPNDNSASIASTAYLLGYLKEQATPSARRVVELLLSHGV